MEPTLPTDAVVVEMGIDDPEDVFEVRYGEGVLVVGDSLAPCGGVVASEGFRQLCADSGRVRLPSFLFRDVLLLLMRLLWPRLRLDGGPE